MKHVKLGALCSSVVMLALVAPVAFAVDPPPPPPPAQTQNAHDSSKYNIASALCSVARTLFGAVSVLL